MIGNSVGAKKFDTENVLQYGKLAPQFAERGGQASPKHGTWSWEAIRITDAHGLHFFLLLYCHNRLYILQQTTNILFLSHSVETE